jgi:hypothetical protein
MRPIAVIEDERVARKILEHLQLPARAPPRGTFATKGPPTGAGETASHRRPEELGLVFSPFVERSRVNSRLIAFGPTI